MSRKIKADDLFTGRELTGPGYVLVTDDDGTIEAIIPDSAAGEDVEKKDGIICPGFINAHCHIELSHLANKIPRDTGLVDFVQAVMSNRQASAEEKEAAMEAAAAELYSRGTVAAGDIVNTADSVSLKKRSKLYWHNFIEISGFSAEGAQKRFDDGLLLRKIFEDDSLPASLTPHSPYSVSARLFELLNHATANNCISIHNQESPAENELYQNKTGDFLRLYKNLNIDIASFIPAGSNSLASWLRYFTQGQKLIAVHNTFTNAADLADPAVHAIGGGLFFCLCPNANLYIEKRLPPADMLAANHKQMVIGTDSLASNTQLDMYAEIKTLQQHFPEIPLPAMLQWATLNGARALGIDARYGSFDKGKQPGIVLISNGNAMRI